MLCRDAAKHSGRHVCASQSTLQSSVGQLGLGKNIAQLCGLYHPATTNEQNLEFARFFSACASFFFLVCVLYANTTVYQINLLEFYIHLDIIC